MSAVEWTLIPLLALSAFDFIPFIWIIYRTPTIDLNTYFPYTYWIIEGIDMNSTCRSLFFRCPPYMRAYAHTAAWFFSYTAPDCCFVVFSYCNCVFSYISIVSMQRLAVTLIKLYYLLLFIIFPLYYSCTICFVTNSLSWNLWCCVQIFKNRVVCTMFWVYTKGLFLTGYSRLYQTDPNSECSFDWIAPPSHVEFRAD